MPAGCSACKRPRNIGCHLRVRASPGTNLNFTASGRLCACPPQHPDHQDTASAWPRVGLAETRYEVRANETSVTPFAVSGPGGNLGRRVQISSSIKSLPTMMSPSSSSPISATISLINSSFFSRIWVNSSFFALARAAIFPTWGAQARIC